MVPDYLPGESLVDIIYNGKDEKNLYAFSQYPRGDKMGYAIRNDRYRYVEWGDSKQLFDYTLDPLETVNRAGDPTYEGIEAELSEALKGWRTITRQHAGPGEIGAHRSTLNAPR